jgi:hypothetical protein
MAKKPDDQRSDSEADRIATDALRRALTTPYKPQSALVGKTSKSPAVQVLDEDRLKRATRKSKTSPRKK